MGRKIQAVQSEVCPRVKMDRYFGVHNKQAMVASSFILWRTAVVVIIIKKKSTFLYICSREISSLQMILLCRSCWCFRVHLLKQLGLLCLCCGNEKLENLGAILCLEYYKKLKGKGILLVWLFIFHH